MSLRPRLDGMAAQPSSEANPKGQVFPPVLGRFWSLQLPWATNVSPLLVVTFLLLWVAAYIVDQYLPYVASGFVVDFATPIATIMLVIITAAYASETRRMRKAGEGRQALLTTPGLLFHYELVEERYFVTNVSHGVLTIVQAEAHHPAGHKMSQLRYRPPGDAAGEQTVGTVTLASGESAEVAGLSTHEETWYLYFEVRYAPTGVKPYWFVGGGVSFLQHPSEHWFPPHRVDGTRAREIVPLELYGSPPDHNAEVMSRWHRMNDRRAAGPTSS